MTDLDDSLAFLGLGAPAPASAAPDPAALTRRQARELTSGVVAPAPRGLGELQPTTALRSRTLTQTPDFPRRSVIAEARKGGRPKKSSKKDARNTDARRSQRVSVSFPKPRRKRVSLGSKLLSLGAMMFAGALLVGMSVPANAFMSNPGGLSPEAAAKEPGQSLAVSAEAAEGSTSRDSFEVISYAEVLRLKYAGISYAYTATTGAVRWPFPYPVPITDGFGPREGGFHKGVDFVPGAGTPIYAIADGVAVTAGYDNTGYGNHVVIQHNLGGVDVKSNYAHMIMDSSPIRVGDQIKVGDFLGLVGDTGIAYGAHLHFEIYVNNSPVDPFAWLQGNAVN